jgi:hypothetical protein
MAHEHFREKAPHRILLNRYLTLYEVASGNSSLVLGSYAPLRRKYLLLLK